MSLHSHNSPADMREDYRRSTLRRSDLASDPMEQFGRWFDKAGSAEIPEPNAFVLATIGLDNLPDSRTVLMKDFGERGITFYTNYLSRKGRELEAHPVASATFLWLGLERQIHLRGRVEKTSREESLTYFQSRPYDSRIGAWASDQSAVIPNRAWLDKRAIEVESEFPDTASLDSVPLPDFWGGFLIHPETVEFWQGGHGRKHDRFLYQRTASGEWTLDRLSP